MNPGRLPVAVALMTLIFWSTACGERITPVPTVLPTGTANPVPATASPSATPTLTATPLPTYTATIQPCESLPAGLLAWWPGDGSARDVVGGHHGSLMKGAAFAPGRVGRAFSFDGVDDYVRIPDHADWSFGDNPFTIDLWIMFGRVTERAPLVDHNEGPAARNKWVFWYDRWGHRDPHGPALRFHLMDPQRQTGSVDTVVDRWEPVTGQWYHVAVTRSENIYSLYIDGLLTVTEKNAYSIPDANTPLSLGQSEYQYYFKGLIDEVAISNRALSAEEVWAIFKAGRAGRCAADS